MYYFAKVFVFFGLLVSLVKAVPTELAHHSVHQDYPYHNGQHELSLDYDSEPKYSFKYGVQDPLNGDDKQHAEEREGDVVRGRYILREADGSIRVVEYQADDRSGFNAVVHHIEEPQQYNVDRVRYQ